MKSHLNTALITISIVITSLVLANAIKNRNKTNNSISVTGLGSKDFESDFIVWSGSFSKKNLNLKQAYGDLDKDRAAIRNYLISQGLKEESLVFSAVEISNEYDEQFDGNGQRKSSVFSGYRLRQNILVESKEVNKVEDISRRVSELINSGVELYSNPPQYYYTKLSALKIEMIAAATKDAKIRAEKIAENAGSDVGRLKNATMGVFQITAQNSSEEYSWGGSFNTTSKKKTATITVKLDYETN